MSGEREIRRAISGIWRNYPDGCVTVGPCPTEGCKNMGRGSGKCADCYEKELASIVGGKYASEYRLYVKRIRTMEINMIEWTRDD